ncbi:unnamed protein product [Pylaiella littoralis]
MVWTTGILGGDGVWCDGAVEAREGAYAEAVLRSFELWKSMDPWSGRRADGRQVGKHGEDLGDGVPQEVGFLHSGQLAPVAFFGVEVVAVQKVHLGAVSVRAHQCQAVQVGEAAERAHTKQSPWSLLHPAQRSRPRVPHPP